MDKSDNYQPSAVSQKLFYRLCGKQHIDDDQDAHSTFIQHQCHICRYYFSISNTSLVVATHESAEYHIDICITILIELQLLQYLLNAQHDACNNEMACFLYIAQSSDPQFFVAHYTGVQFVTHYNFDAVYQIVVPKSGGFCELLINKLYATPLASHLGVQKLTHALFQRVWQPKIQKTVTSSNDS